MFKNIVAKEISKIIRKTLTATAAVGVFLANILAGKTHYYGHQDRVNLTTQTY
jgi:hypothetical protein